VMATVEEVSQLANVTKFLKELDVESTSKMCHQAVTWLAIQIKRNALMDYNVHLCTGTYDGLEHSWMLVEGDDQELVVVDMTLNQFIDCEVPYTGGLKPPYCLNASISMASEGQEIVEFVEALGA
jgi:hypothetical protein